MNRNDGVTFYLITFWLALNNTSIKEAKTSHQVKLLDKKEVRTGAKHPRRNRIFAEVGKPISLIFATSGFILSAHICFLYDV